MSLFKTLPLSYSIFSSCREYFNKTNDNIKQHSVQYNSYSYHIFFFKSHRGRGDYVAAHHDDARTAHVHSVALEPQLALPLWKQHCVLHGPEHQRRSTLRVRVGVRGQRERRLYQSKRDDQRHACAPGLTPLPSRVADWAERLDECRVPDCRHATGVAAREAHEPNGGLRAQLRLAQEMSVRALWTHVNYHLRPHNSMIQNSNADREAS